MRTLRSQHGVDCQKLQEELELQKSKEERQRALLQLQWKAMDENPQEDPEVNSKKGHSVSSIKKDSDGKNRNQQRPENDGMIAKKPSSPFLRATQPPVTNIMKQVDPGGGIPKHGRKVTHREYEWYL